MQSKPRQGSVPDTESKTNQICSRSGRNRPIDRPAPKSWKFLYLGNTGRFHEKFIEAKLAEAEMSEHIEALIVGHEHIESTKVGRKTEIRQFPARRCRFIS